MVVFSVASGQRTDQKEAWWWNNELESIQEKKKNWDGEKTEESRQDNKVTRCEAKIELARAKQNVYNTFYKRFNKNHGKKGRRRNCGTGSYKD